MAKDSGSVLNIALIVGGGFLAYYLYENYVANSAVVAAAPPSPTTTPNSTIVGTGTTSTGTTSGGTSSTPPPPPPPAVNAYPLSSSIPDATQTAATLSAALIKRATSDGVAKGGLVNGQIAYTPQQWNYVFNELNPGNTKNLPSSSQVMSADSYVFARANMFGQAGLSGFGQLLRVGRNHLRTGGRNYLRAGAPMRRIG